MEKKKKLAATEGKDKEIFKSLPPKVCGLFAAFSVDDGLLLGYVSVLFSWCPLLRSYYFRPA